MAVMFTQPVPHNRPNPLSRSQLDRKHASGRGWWPEQPEGLTASRLDLALWWSRVLAEEIQAQTGRYQALVGTVGPESPELRRIQGVIAADRSLFEFWYLRARKAARNRAYSGEGTTQSLGVMVQPQPTTTQVLGPVRVIPELEQLAPRT